MKARKIADVLMFYADELDRLGVERKELEDYKKSSSDVPEDMQLSHVRWMCETAIDFTKRRYWFFFPDLGKANRWLGFIQGVLWMANLFPIHSMRDHNRPD